MLAVLALAWPGGSGSLRAGAAGEAISDGTRAPDPVQAPVATQTPVAQAPAPAPTPNAGSAPAPVPVPAPASETDSAPAAAPPAGQPQPAAEDIPAPTSPAEAVKGGSLATTAADQAAIDEVRVPASYLRTAMDALEQDVEAAQTNEDELARQRVEIDALMSGGDLFLESLQPRYTAVNEQLTRLGPLPEKDAPAEAPAIAAERARLATLAAEIDGAIKATGLVQYRARELLTRVQEYRSRLFTSQLLRRSSSPLRLQTWEGVADAIPPAMRELRWTMWRWQRSATDNIPAILALFGAALAAYLILFRLRSRIFAVRLDQRREGVPDFFERASTAGWVATLLAAPAAVASAILTLGLDATGLWFLDTDRLALTVLPALLIFIAVRVLSRAILQPSRPEWRLVDLADAPARSLTRAITAIGGIYALDLIFKEIVRILAMPLSVSVAQAFIASILLALLLLQIVRTPFVRRSTPEAGPVVSSPEELPELPSPGDAPLLSPHILKIPLLGFALFIVVTSLMGYVALGRFVAGQVIVSGSIVVLGILLHLAIRALVSGETRQDRAIGRVMHDRLGLDDGQTRTLSHAAGVLLDSLLALMAVPLILVTWGFSLPDTLAWLKSLIFGFEIGHVRISLVQIAGAVLLFVALLFVTRMIQRWISATFLTTARVDAGVANSIHKAIGYAGFALALLTALSYAGLDITNLAIVAGALSVGIGFGLQSIINNFVSGLILLIERPIKIGDLIVVNGHTGRVRNIAVRSTEIETGDKATIIVPNSELITASLVNWTHRNALSRASVKLTVSYRSEPEKVREVLLRVAGECQLLMQQPRPDVSFDNFGANGFEFTVGGLTDIGRAGAAQTDLRFRIVKAFRENGIEMPHAQYDVHLRDLDLVRSFVQRVQDERARQGREAPPTGPGDGAGPPPGTAGGLGKDS